MSSCTQPFPASGRVLPAVPTAVFEMLGYLCVVGVGALCFLFGWLTPNGAAVLTVLLLTYLIVLAWVRLDRGRHPCFLFLCALMLLQCGRLIGYCLGVTDSDLYRVWLMRATPFDITRDETGVVLLSITLSAICIYAPCRWRYHRLAPPSHAPVRDYLPYLYLLFFCCLPFQLLKNYLYLRYGQQHGGYQVFFMDYSGLAASVPPIVRVISLFVFPVFVAIFVFETRKKWIWTVTFLYFATAVLYLLTGTRMDTFALVLALWYVARIQSTKRPQILRLAVVAVGLILVANMIQSARVGDDSSPLDIGRFVAEQGISLDVTEVAVRYAPLFRPYVGSYALQDLRAKFFSNDQSQYVRGWSFVFDMSAFLNPNLFKLGFGTGGSYLADGYLIAGVFGVALLSLMIGFLLSFFHACSKTCIGLFFVAAILPDVFLMPRGGSLIWVSMLIRTAIVITPVIAGWYIFQYFALSRPAAAAKITLWSPDLEGR